MGDNCPIFSTQRQFDLTLPQCRVYVDLPLSSVSHTTSSAVLHTITSTIPSMYFSLCRPLYTSSLLYESQQHTLLQSICSYSMAEISEQSPSYGGHQCTLSVPAIPQTSSFVLLAVHGILNIFLKNHISAAVIRKFHPAKIPRLG